MKIMDEVINRLSDLSMINIGEHDKKAITVELKELVGKLQVVSDVECELLPRWIIRRVSSCCCRGNGSSCTWK